MESFKDAVVGMFTQEDGYWSRVFGDTNEYELCLEPLTYGQFYVALYHHGGLIGAKLPVKPGGPA